MNHLKLVSSVFAIALSLVACGDDTDFMPGETGGPGEPEPEPEEGAVFVTFNNLPELGEGFVYEGWLVIDGEVTSVARFDSDGTAEITMNQELPDGIESADAYVLSIEPDPETGDDLTDPSEVKLLGGDFDEGEAALTIGHPAAIGDDLTEDTASGDFFIATPTSADTTDEAQGIWFLDPTQTPPVTSLTLPVLPCLLYTSPSPRDATLSRMPSSA